MLDQGGFARAYLARDDNETLLLGKPVGQVGHCPTVADAAEKEPTIRGKLKGSSGQSVQLVIHERVRHQNRFNSPMTTIFWSTDCDGNGNG